MFSMFLRSIWYDRWINLAVGFGVLCTAAVLTGATLVGDSMKGSLKALTLDRLGSIDSILFAPGFVENPKIGGTAAGSRQASPVILLPAAAELNEKICGIQLLGQGTTCFANQALADKIGLQTGKTVSLRLMLPQSVPPESALGRKDQLLRTQIAVEKIVPNQGIGRFSLKTDTQAEPLLIVPIQWLQQRLNMPNKVNAIFLHSDSPEHVLPPKERNQLLLSAIFKLSLSDLGIIAEKHNGKTYIKSARMLFNDNQVAVIDGLFKTADGSQRGLLYLAKSIWANNKETPYSTIYAVHSTELQLSETEIALNRWTADDLGAEIGNEVRLNWFNPDNVTEEHSQTFTLAKILPMEGLGADPHVVPTVQGFTDESSIADWNPPFPFDAKKIRQKDEEYWDKYQAAPKAFVSLETGQKLFGSRFGKITTLVVNDGTDPGVNATKFLTNVRDFPTFGINLVPVKEQGLAASSGTTPFSVLFLCFSFFIIASALMLVLLLFRLSVEMKSRRIGIQLAVGWPAGLIAKMLLTEAVLITVIASFFGSLLGIAYAALMIYGLTTWWAAAVTVPFLTLYITGWSLFFGFFSGVVLAMLTILWSLRGIRKVPVRMLLCG